MIKMIVTGMGIEQSTGQPIVMLNDDQKLKVLPILIGVAEAKSIARALHSERTKRPSTHELFCDTIYQLGCELDHVEIESGVSDVYHAKLVLVPSARDENTTATVIDARPSDAISLAILEKAPIMVADHIAMTLNLNLTDGSAEDTKEFAKFVSDVKASDFNRYGEGLGGSAS